MLRCPRCRQVVGHPDRKGGGLGYIVRNRYVIFRPETRQILVACPECSQEILMAQLVADTDRGERSSSS